MLSRIFPRFYAINNYKRCEVYLIVSYDENSRYDLFCDWFKYSPYYTRNVPQDTELEASRSVWGMMHVLVIAEKGKESTNHRIPTQLQYLEEDNCDWTQTYKKWNICKNPDLMLEDRNINLLRLIQLTSHILAASLKVIKVLEFHYL